MCGIVGINYNDKNLLKKMLSSIEHRGPDGQGTEINNDYSLGMRRLSIIDPKSGWQPIWNENHTKCIFMNGEIYNHSELRTQLSQLGHKFSTDHSDTETVLHGFEEWHENVLQKLTGMFVFTIYDTETKELFIARDRLGIKPLYYTTFTDNDGNTKVIYASEIKAILQSPKVKFEPNLNSIYRFILYRVHDSDENTFFEGIKRLLPTHYMILTPTGIKEIKKYWEPKFNPQFFSDRSDEDYAQEFFEKYQEVLKRHLISDVPVGVTLSGGLDSSAVTCVTRELMDAGQDLNTKNKLYTFSALFPGMAVDESKYIKAVEKYANTTPVYAYPKVDGFWDELQDWIYTQEEPTISSAPYAYYSVYKVASKHVKVTLSGNGGDELLAGYVPYFKSYITSAQDNGAYGNIIKEIFKGFDIYAKYFGWKLDFANPFMHKFEIKKLITENLKQEGEDFVFAPSRNLNERLFMDVLKYSTPNLLRYEDKNSMAFSIESRVPFLDHQLVEYIFNLPIDQKIKNGWNRYVYRNAMKGHIPEINRNRRSKIGFANPELIWMREKAEKIAQIFDDDTTLSHNLFDGKSAARIIRHWASHPNSYATDVMIFWRILVVELWLRRFS